MTSPRQAVFAAAIWIAFSVWTQATTRPVELWQHKIISIQNERRFSFKSGTNGKTADGADFSTVTYESSDGFVISAITETYATKVKARRALQERLRGVSRVLSRAPKTAPNGKRMDSRIVVRFAREDSYRSRFMIFWIDGAELHSIGAASLRHAQEFENAFN